MATVKLPRRLKFPDRLVEQFGVSPVHGDGLYVPTHLSGQSPLRSQARAIAVSPLAKIRRWLTQTLRSTWTDTPSLVVKAEANLDPRKGWRAARHNAEVMARVGRRLRLRPDSEGPPATHPREAALLASDRLRGGSGSETPHEGHHADASQRRACPP